MTPWLADPDVTLYHGDALAVLRELPAESVDCCVTSPPYWGLRDYGSEGQLGLEPTPEEYVARMVEVFREVRRVLAGHGTVWLNLGDSYGSGTTADRNPTSTQGPDVPSSWSNRSQPQRNGLKPKDLVGIPWRVAFALQADGWYLRSDIIWAKPNPMPESVTDRPTKSHEYVFLLSKQPRYFFDQEAVREPAEWRRWGDQTYSPEAEAIYGQRIKPRTKAELTPRNDGERWNEANGRGFTPTTAGRNIRSIWEIATQPYPEAHFATFPEELARRCIAAGCPEQVCRTCGAPRQRIIEKVFKGDGSPIPYEDRAEKGSKMRLSGPQLAAWKRANPDSHLGLTDCECDGRHGWVFEDGPSSKYRPGVTLDPFIGSGTVAHVARKLGRHAVGIDLSEEYLKLAARRLQQQSLFAEAAS